MKIFKKISITVAILFCTKAALANDCGWDGLTLQEQKTVADGKMVMRASDDTVVKEKSHIDMWSYSKKSSLTEAVANFYDASAFDNAGGVADITLADGEVSSNNPVTYKVTPKSTNPFGSLYQPFMYSARVHVEGEGFIVKLDYLTSPGLIKHVYNDVCFVRINDKVLVRFLSTVTDSENPMLSRDSKAFGWPVRKMLWGKIFLEDIARTEVPATPKVINNLYKALLGDFGN